MADSRFVGNAMRRRMGAESSYYGMEDNGTCREHHPVALHTDGSAMVCDSPAGHSGDHMDHSHVSLGEITAWPNSYQSATAAQQSRYETDPDFRRQIENERNIPRYGY